MDNFLKLIVSQLNGFWNGMDAASRRRMIISAVVVLAIASTITWFLAKPDYVILYPGLDHKEAGEIYAKLEEWKMNPQVVGTGTIRVPKRYEDKARMDLAAEGYPKNGISSSDYFQNSTGLGATDFDKRMAERLQLQDRLQNAIMTMDGVSSVMVTLSMPEQDSFVLKENRKEPTASIRLVLKSSSLTKQQVKGIEQLVAKSVSGLKPENISIVDGNMRALNSIDDSGAGIIGNQFELESQLKSSLQKQVVNLLEPVFGRNGVMVSADVRLDFTKKVTNSVKFSSPDGQDGEGIAVSINELKEAVSNEQADGNAGSGDYTNTNKTINYEVNQTKEQIEEAQGQIKSLTLSVLINKPDLSEQMKSDIQELVQKAVGVNDAANIVVRGMAFEGLKEQQDEGNKQKEKNEKDETWKKLWDIGSKVAMILLLVFILFIIYRFITNLKLPNSSSPAIRGFSATIPQAKFMEDIIEMPEEDPEQAMKKRRIDNLIDNKPDVVAQQIKDWLNEN